MLIIVEKKRIIMVSIIIIVIIGAIYMFYLNYNYNLIEEDQEIREENISNKNEAKDDEEIIIHVAGAVKKPGIVKLKIGSRVEDAIDAAGGLLNDSDITNINLAHILEDGIKIKIPSKNDEKNEKYIIDGLSDDFSSEKEKNKLININTATKNELENLRGIGPSLAIKIVEYRNKNGKFKKIEDIKNVSGIGSNKYEKIKDYIKI